VDQNSQSRRGRVVLNELGRRLNRWGIALFWLVRWGRRRFTWLRLVKWIIVVWWGLGVIIGIIRIGRIVRGLEWIKASC